MPRPKKRRRISFEPKSAIFKPAGISKFELDEVVLKFEELEAIRLKDIEGLSQIECAEKMDVSRQTFQIIIESSRRKIATALYNGMAIRIDGGHYVVSNFENSKVKLKVDDENISRPRKHNGRGRIKNIEEE